MPGKRGASKQRDRAERDQVAVALEDVVVAKEDDRRGERGEAQEEERRLLDGQALLDPVEHHQADRREDRAEREEVRIRVRERRAQEEVRRDADREEVAAVGEAERADLVRADGEHRREAGAHEERDRDQREELARCARSSAAGPLLLSVLPRSSLAVAVVRPVAGCLFWPCCWLLPLLSVFGGIVRRLDRRGRGLLEVVEEVHGVVARAQVVIGRLVAAVLGQRLDPRRRGRDLRVELDAERQVVGKAAVEREAPALVGAEEVDLARGEEPGRDDARDDEQRDQAT